MNSKNNKQSIALDINNLSFSYQEKKALDQINFSVLCSECTILLGPNGAGKSTLFALVTRLYDSHHGTIRICHHDVKTETRQALGKLGVVFQQTTLDLDLTVKQNLHYHAALHGISRKQANLRIQEELEILDMYERQGETVRQLNGGHKRRVEIARALLHKPALLLLDEPTVGLDVPSRQSIVKHVHDLVVEHKLAVLWATHLIDEVYPDDQLLILHKGEIKSKGSVSEVLKASNTESINEAFRYYTQGEKV